VQNILFLYLGHRGAVSVWGKSNRPPPNSGDVRVTPTEDGGEVPRDNPSAQRSLVCVTTPRCPMQQKQTNQNPKIQTPVSLSSGGRVWRGNWWVEDEGPTVRSALSGDRRDARVVLTRDHDAVASCSRHSDLT
jgi:hypothetical protein